MHTKTIGPFTVHHNGDYSGDVRILVHTENVTPAEKAPSHVFVDLPFDLLKTLVAGYVRGRRISDLEDASEECLLGLQQRQ